MQMPFVLPSDYMILGIAMFGVFLIVLVFILFLLDKAGWFEGK